MPPLGCEGALSPRIGTGCQVGCQQTRWSHQLPVGGGRSLRFSLVSLDWNSGWVMTLSLSELEKKVTIARSGACLGEKKF